MLSSLEEAIGLFIVAYPIGMAIVWMICGFQFYREKEKNVVNDLGQVNNWPEVTILIPCHNEEQVIVQTCEHLLKIDYPSYRVVFIDDASTDQTAAVVRSCVKSLQNFHLLKLQENQGKAIALNCALKVSVSTPVTIIMDADTIPDPLAIKHLVKHLVASKNIGAVTGQPIVYNREKLLERMQAVEFTSIIGLIKRAQNFYGYLFSISGCMTAFKTEALLHVKGFSFKTATEDIDITWSLQKSFYRVLYCPQALAYIQVPNEVREFWKQRTRWALGGWHLLRTHYGIFLNWNWRRLWVIYIDILLSYVWAILFVIGGSIWFVGIFTFTSNQGFNPLPSLTSIITVVCIIQLLLAIKLAKLYDSTIHKHLFLIAWYPIFYFLFGALTVIRTSMKGLFQDLDRAGKWKSPRRLKPNNIEEE